MDPVTGLIVFGDLEVELGRCNKQLPGIMHGHVKIGKFTPKFKPHHRYVITGKDRNNVNGYICECGEAFLGLALAMDHFYGSVFNIDNQHDFAIVNNGNKVKNTKKEIQSALDLQEGENDAKRGHEEMGKLSDKSTNASDEHDVSDDLDDSDDHEDSDDPNDSTTSNDNMSVSSSNTSEEESDSEDESESLNNEGDGDACVNFTSSDSSSSTQKIAEVNDDSNVYLKRILDQQKLLSKSEKSKKAKLIITAICIQFGFNLYFRYKDEVESICKITRHSINKYLVEIQRKRDEDGMWPTNVTKEVLNDAKVIHHKVMDQLNEKYKELSSKEQKLLDLQAFTATYGYDFSIPFKRTLAQRWKTTSKYLYKRLTTYKNQKEKLVGIPEECFVKAKKVYEQVCWDLKKKMLGIHKFDNEKENLEPSLEKRLIMESLFEIYNFKVKMKHRKICADQLGLSLQDVSSWLRKAKRTKYKKSLYKDQISNSIKNKSMKLKRIVSKTSKKLTKHDAGIDSKCVIESKRLVIEALMLETGDVLQNLQYRTICSTIIGLSISALNKYFAAFNKRRELKLENPYKIYLTEEILERGRKLHNDVLKQRECQKGKQDDAD